MTVATEPHEHDWARGYGVPTYCTDCGVIEESALVEAINRARPAPVADENGDVHCLRLWPIADCQYVSGHYGGCSPR